MHVAPHFLAVLPPLGVRIIVPIFGIINSIKITIVVFLHEGSVGTLWVFVVVWVISNVDIIVLEVIVGVLVFLMVHADVRILHDNDTVLKKGLAEVECYEELVLGACKLHIRSLVAREVIAFSSVLRNHRFNITVT